MESGRTDLGVSPGRAVGFSRSCFVRELTARRLWGTSSGEAVLRCAVPIGQVPVTHLTSGVSSRQKCKDPGASPGNPSSFVNATSQVLLSCA